jgi:hypothetical protein
MLKPFVVDLDGLKVVILGVGVELRLRKEISCTYMDMGLNGSGVSGRTMHIAALHCTEWFHSRNTYTVPNDTGSRGPANP